MMTLAWPSARIWARPLAALRSLAILGSGRVLARLAMVAALPLLARRYDAEAFGLFGASTWPALR